jgi:hypothetical protein
LQRHRKKRRVAKGKARALGELSQTVSNRLIAVEFTKTDLDGNRRPAYALKIVLTSGRRIEVCPTAVLGGHLEQCDQCGHKGNADNSSSDRHCPKSRPFARAQWLDHRQSQLLNTQYFHVVFTVPEQIATISYQNFMASCFGPQRRPYAPSPLGTEFQRLHILHLLQYGFYGFGNSLRRQRFPFSDNRAGIHTRQHSRGLYQCAYIADQYVA